MYGSPSLGSPTFAPNAVINGDCRVSQLYPQNQTSGYVYVSGTGYSYRDLDMWARYYNSTNFLPLPLTIIYDGQYYDHPILGAAGACLRWGITNNVGTVGSDDVIGYVNNIEASDLAPFVAQAGTELSFWVYSGNIGNHYVTLRRSATPQQNDGARYIARFTVDRANVWQRVVLPIAFPTSVFGTVGAGSNTFGVLVLFPLLCGADVIGGTNNTGVWETTQFVVGPGYSQFDNSKEFRVTDLMISYAGGWQRFPRLPLQNVLNQVQRHFWHTAPYGTTIVSNVPALKGGLFYNAAVAAAVQHGVWVQHPVSMRQAPTLTTYNPIAAGANWGNATTVVASGVPAVATNDATEQSVYVTNPQVAADAVGNKMRLHVEFNARMLAHTP